MTRCSESLQKAVVPTPLQTTKAILKIASWNVRITFESGEETEVAQEVENSKIFQRDTMDTVWKVQYSGHEGAPHAKGVASKEQQQALINWEAVDPWIVTARFTMKKGKRQY